MAFLVTGAAGFIGSNLVHAIRRRWPHEQIVSFDKLTYAGNLRNLAALAEDPLHAFVRGDICAREQVREVFERFDVTGVFHLAAESHVDRSIVEPLAFIRTNIEGTAILMQEATAAWRGRSDARFLHVSTDEVFGSLGADGLFHEDHPYSPRSPYSASKAASDHLVRAWIETYGLPAVITNCTNNYGPYQFPEKLVPVTITRALEGRPVPVYGRGENVRDWLYVEDHCDALLRVYEAGRIGETYCIGGESERRNLDLVYVLLDEVDRALGRSAGQSRALVEFVTDRPGHDFRYAMDIGKLRRDLGWQPSVTLEEGMRRTVQWYLSATEWLDSVRSGAYRDFEALWYGERMGKSKQGDRS